MRCQSLWSPCKTCCKVCQFHFPSGESGHSGELNQAGGPWEGGGGWLLGVFHPQANMGIVVFNSSSYTEPASLASIGLFTGLFFRTSFLKGDPRLPDELGGGGSCPSQAQLHVLGQAAQLDGKECLPLVLGLNSNCSFCPGPASGHIAVLWAVAMGPPALLLHRCHLLFGVFWEKQLSTMALGSEPASCTEVQFWFE